jgi:cell division protein FtsZ
VAHPDANIIFGSIIDDEMGDEVRVTVIAAGFDRWDERDGRNGAATTTSSGLGSTSSRVLDEVDVFSSPSSSASDDLGLDNDDEFDVPSFLK